MLDTANRNNSLLVFLVKPSPPSYVRVSGDVERVRIAAFGAAGAIGERVDNLPITTSQGMLRRVFIGTGWLCIHSENEATKEHAGFDPGVLTARL
jgi:hypothetical protein